MPIGISKFEQVAGQGGALTLDSEGKGLNVYGGGFLGRAVVWWKGTGTGARSSNAAVAKEFLEAVRNTYGESYALRVSQNIDTSGAKPLLSRDVQQVIAGGKALIARNLKDQEYFCDLFGKDKGDDSRPTFGNLLKAAMSEKLPGVKLEDLDTTSLERAIRKDISSEGNGGRQGINLHRARELAEARIAKFVENKERLVRQIESLPGASSADRAKLKAFALKHDISDPKAITQLWSMREASISLLRTLGNPETSPTEKLNALNLFQARYNEALTPLISQGAKENFGADDLIDFASNCLELGATLGEFSKEEMTNLFGELSKPAIKELREAFTRAYSESEELGIGTESSSKLRAFNDTLGAVLRLSGQAAGKTPDEIREANTPSNRYEKFDEVPAPILTSLQNLGITDVNYTLEKQVRDLSPGENREIASQALFNIRLTRQFRSESNDFKRASLFRSQVDVLMEHRSRILASTLPDGVKAALLSSIDKTIASSFRQAKEALAKAGTGDEPTLRWLESARDALDTLLAQPMSGGARTELRELRTAYQSEIFTRRDPGYKALSPTPRMRPDEVSMNRESQQRMIQARYMQGKIVTEGLRSEFSKPLNLPVMREHSERSVRARDRMRELSGRPGFTGVEGDRARRRIDTIRLGSSDTIQGKSGGGELEGKKEIAKRNWHEGARVAQEIARSGRPITLRQIQELNVILNRDMPANGGVPGQFRQRPETAGGGASYPPPERVPELMEEFITWLNENSETMDPAQLAGMAYQKLVSIHPFDDANGRTSRLVVDAILQSKGYPPAAYQGSEEFNVGVFGVPQRNTTQLKPEDSVSRTLRAIERSLEIYGEELSRV